MPLSFFQFLLLDFPMTPGSHTSRSDAQTGRAFAESHPLDKAGDGLWQHYLATVEHEDAADVESWNGSTTGILTFVRPFKTFSYIAV